MKVLKASFFGFVPQERELEVTAEVPVDIGVIQMKPKMLNQVTVEGQYIPIQIKGDTIEYDARAFETKEHDVVEDLLEQLPGVEVEDDGTIKIQGEEVEQVLVDGEKFFGDDPKIATQNLPANAIEKVQVFDKKSEMSEFTGVDDGSESPTINLKLKESHKKGVFGNFEAGIGIDQPYNDQLLYQSKGNVHYFQKKWQLSAIGMSNNVNETGFTFSDYMNFSGGAQNIMRQGGGGFQSSGLPSAGDSDNGFLNTHATGVNFNYHPTEQTNFTAAFFVNVFDKTYNKTLERLTYFSDSTVVTNEWTNQNSNTFNNRGDLKLEQKFDSTHFLNINFSGSWNDASYFNNGLVNNYNAQDNLSSRFNTNLGQDEFNYTLDFETAYRKKFEKPGRFTGGGLNLNASKNDAATDLIYYSELYNAGIVTGAIRQDQYSISSTNGIAADWMWSEPVSKNQLLQPGYTFTSLVESRDKSVYDLVSDNEVLNPFLSASGDYKQASHAFQLKHKYISNSLLTTLSANYQVLTLSGNNLFSASRGFGYFLPSARIEWDPTKNGNLRLNYKTSVSAPTLSQLQPIPDNTSPAEIVLGNLDLIPEYNHSLQLRFRNFNQFNFTFIMASLTGRYVQNNITYSQHINEFLIREITPENLGEEKSLSAFLAYGTSLYPIKTKFHLSLNGSVANGLVNLNGQEDQYTSYVLSPKINIENIRKKRVNLRTGFAYNFSANRYLDNTTFNTSFNNWNYYGDFTLNLKDRWVFNAHVSHYFYPDFETNSQFVLLDARIACNLLKSRKLQIYVSGNDLLNQNTGINQYYLQNIYEEEITQTLARYFMFGVKYAFQKLGAK